MFIYYLYISHRYINDVAIFFNNIHITWMHQKKIPIKLFHLLVHVKVPLEYFTLI